MIVILPKTAVRAYNSWWHIGLFSWRFILYCTRLVVTLLYIEWRFPIWQREQLVSLAIICYGLVVMFLCWICLTRYNAIHLTCSINRPYHFTSRHYVWCLPSHEGAPCITVRRLKKTDPVWTAWLSIVLCFPPTINQRACHARSI